MEIVKLNINRAVKAIRCGKILVCPTDTVYGLVCDATNKKTLTRLYKIKKRPRAKHIPIFIYDIKMAKKLARIDIKQEKILEGIWPGKVTAVLRKKRERGTIGLRIPKDDFMLCLLRRISKPLTGTSANVSGRPASTKIKEVIKQFEVGKHRPDLIVDTGNLPKNKPSKVIDLTVCPPKILRS